MSAKPIKIELELDLDQYLARSMGYDEDGEPVTEPTTVEDVILGLAANKLLASSAKQEAGSWLLTRVQSIRDEEIREQIRPLITEALTKALQPASVYGEPKGEPTTLAEIITKQALAELRTPRDQGYGHQKKTLVQEMITKEVTSSFTAELKKELEAGKEQVRKVLREQGAALIEQAIEKAGAGR